MRIRTIKPEFFASLTLDKLSLTAQRTFIGLLCYCDDHGRGLDDARLIKAALWPLRDRHTAAKVETDLSEIAALGLIHRYEAQGDHLIQVTAWKEHQRISHPLGTKYPPFPEGSGDLPEGSGKLPEDARKPPENPPREGKGREGKEPPTPAERGIENASPRTQGKNPRALGTNPRAVATRDSEERRRRQAECQTCDGMGVVMVDDDAAPCPDCREAKAS